MQVRGDHRQAGQVVGVGERRVVLGGGLVDAEHDRLQRRVPGLDQVAGVPVRGAGRVRGQAVGQRDHQGVTAGAQAQRQRAGVEQHPVADGRLADQVGVGQRAQWPARHLGGQFQGTAPPAAERGHQPVPPENHGHDVNASGSTGPGSGPGTGT